MTQGENRNAGLLAIAAAALGLVAVVAIVLSGMGHDAIDAEGEVASRGIRGERGGEEPGAGSGGPSGGPSGGAAADASMPPGAARARAADGGLDEAIAEAASDLEAVRERRDPADFRPSPEEIERDRAEAARIAATLTPEQRYEAQAFFHDLLVLRADALRTQVAAAREAGDEVALRRLEPALAIVTEELGRSGERMRTLASELGRSSEPTEDRGEVEGGEGGAGEGGEGEEAER